MQKTVRAMFAPSFLVVAFAALGKLYAADATVIYHDDFSTVAGYQEINTDGELTETGVPEFRSPVRYTFSSVTQLSVVRLRCPPRKTTKRWALTKNQACWH
jgi:hypothetical protein